MTQIDAKQTLYFHHLKYQHQKYLKETVVSFIMVIIDILNLLSCYYFHYSFDEVQLHQALIQTLLIYYQKGIYFCHFFFLSTFLRIFPLQIQLLHRYLHFHLIKKFSDFSYLTFMNSSNLSQKNVRVASKINQLEYLLILMEYAGLLHM